tara:strand:+ start:8 stop:2392 length:2385 start_codon:yes stop_codon:yes gene_type:complete
MAFETALNGTVTEHMRITSAGNVSIGSSNNGVGGSIDLSVGSTSTSGGITLWSTTSASHSIGWGDGYTGSDRYRGYIEYAHNGDYMRFATAATERMRITSAGHLNITENINLLDSKAVTLGTDGDAQIWSDGSNTYIRNNTSNQDIVFQVNDDGSTETEVMRIDASTSRVGIGTASPAKPLHVVGSALVKAGAIFELTGDINPGNSTTTVPGTSTLFLTEVSIGDTITLGAETRTVTAIASNTSLTVDATFSTDLATDTTPQCTPAAFTVLNSGGTANHFKLDANSRISLSNNDAGSNNTVFGKLAGNALASGGQHNLCIGEESGHDISTGDNNVSVGSYSNDKVSTNGDNTAIGYEAHRGNGGQNTVVGSYAVDNESGEADSIVVVGHQAMRGDTTAAADGTVAVGAFALGALTIGAENTAVGYQSLQDMVDGAANTVIGYQAALDLNHADADGNVSIGAFTMDGVAGVALHSCTVVGTGALSGALTAGAVGSTAVGRNALGALTSGAGNTAVGYLSGQYITTGANNTFIGSDAGKGASGSGGHDNNTAVGQRAGLLLQGSADANTFLGRNAGSTVTTGTNNVVIGEGSSTDDATATNQTVLGTGTTGVADNSVTLGNASVTAVYAASDGDAVVYCGGINMSLNQPAADAGSMTHETLDHYEEGTWDAVLSDGTNAMVMNSSYDEGYYTRIGNLVTVSGYFVTTSLGSASGGVRILGLPFTSTNSISAYTGGGAGHGYGLEITAGHSVSYYMEKNSTYVNLRVWDATIGPSDLTAAQWTADGGIMIGFSYRTT